jgi:hypothetical protein
MSNLTKEGILKTSTVTRVGKLSKQPYINNLNFFFYDNDKLRYGYWYNGQTPAYPTLKPKFHDHLYDETETVSDKFMVTLKAIIYHHRSVSFEGGGNIDLHINKKIDITKNIESSVVIDIPDNYQVTVLIFFDGTSAKVTVTDPVKIETEKKNKIHYFKTSLFDYWGLYNINIDSNFKVNHRDRKKLHCRIDPSFLAANTCYGFLFEVLITGEDASAFVVPFKAILNAPVILFDGKLKLTYSKGLLLTCELM